MLGGKEVGDLALEKTDPVPFLHGSLKVTQWFSTFSMHQSYLEGLLGFIPKVSESVNLEQSLKIHLSSKL